jgi:predicted phosphodiesterase
MNCPKCGSINLKRNGSGRGVQRMKCLDCRADFPIDADAEIVFENVRLAKQRQKQQDINRIERKAFREFARLDNALLEANEKLRELLEKHTLNFKIQKHKSSKEEAVLLVQLSDLHFNELVNLPHNKYDFTIASKRLKKYADKIKQYATLNNIKSVLIAITGDLMNSDRRLDEMLNMATNRNNATFLGFLLLEQFILDLNQSANINIACISGNESRAKEEKGYSDIIATDNYDFTIFNMLKVGFRNKGINFIEGDASELVVDVNGVNILLLHGEGLETDTQKKVQQIIGKYVARGVEINFVIYGHVHSAYLSDYSARSSSLVGSNDYNEKALFLASKASQNIHIIYKNGIDGIRVDLQNTDGIEGYQIKKELEAYNTKSASKLHHKQTIYQIVV